MDSISKMESIFQLSFFEGPMNKNKTNSQPLEKTLWQTADKLRKNMDAAEYKHIVLGLIFLKYISDAFEELYTKLKHGDGEYEGADPENKNEFQTDPRFPGFLYHQILW